MVGDIRIPRSPFGRGNPQPLFEIMDIYEYELTREYTENKRDNDSK
jgi:hypothetical protein